MLPSFLTTIFFSISVICGNRSAKILGGVEANFWRLTCASTFLSIWAYSYGKGLSGEAFPLFLLSGLIGIGFGDVALFQALPQLGSRLTLLLVQCLTAPFAAAIEWMWLGTKLTPLQMLCSTIILVGVGISLAPDKRPDVAEKKLTRGVVFSIAAALGGAWGAVLSRKAYAVAKENGEFLDGGTAAFQRIIGGLLIASLVLLVIKWRSIHQHVTLAKDASTLPSKEKWKRVWPWVLANSFAGQTLGVSCYQWAFKTTPTGIVLPIVALTPLVAIPFSLYIEGERPSLHSIVGGVIAVGGVIGLALLK